MFSFEKAFWEFECFFKHLRNNAWSFDITPLSQQVEQHTLQIPIEKWFESILSCSQSQWAKSLKTRAKWKLLCLLIRFFYVDLNYSTKYSKAKLASCVNRLCTKHDNKFNSARLFSPFVSRYVENINFSLLHKCIGKTDNLRSTWLCCRICVHRFGRKKGVTTIWYGNMNQSERKKLCWLPNKMKKKLIRKWFFDLFSAFIWSDQVDICVSLTTIKKTDNLLVNRA